MKIISILVLALLAFTSANQTTLRGNKDSSRALDPDAEEKVVLQEFQNVKVVPAPTKKRDRAKPVLPTQSLDKKKPSDCCCKCPTSLPEPCVCSCTKPMARGGYFKIGDIKGEAKRLRKQEEKRLRKQEAKRLRKEEAKRLRKKQAAEAERLHKKQAAEEERLGNKQEAEAERLRKKQEAEAERIRRKEERNNAKRNGQGADDSSEEDGPHRNLCDGDDCNQDEQSLDSDTSSLPPPCQGDNCEIKESGLDVETLEPAESMLVCCCACTEFPCDCEC